jgi:SNF2 family DNA or RNA helicase
VQLKTDKHIKDWNAGKIPIMLMHPASGGHGLNLQAGGHIIAWYGLNDSLELYEQFNARLDRQGQKETVVINRLIVPGTEDISVANNLSKKNKTQAGLMEAVKALVNKYQNNFKK